MGCVARPIVGVVSRVHHEAPPPPPPPVTDAQAENSEVSPVPAAVAVAVAKVPVAEVGRSMSESSMAAAVYGNV